MNKFVAFMQNKMFLPVFLVLLGFATKFASAGMNLGLGYGDNIGLGTNNPVQIVTALINIVLTFLGLLAIIIVLIAGFRWMTAGGDTAKVESAKKWLVNGLVGMVLIFAAWGITKWVMLMAASLTNIDAGG
jgi:hypothetical protein